MGVETKQLSPTEAAWITRNLGRASLAREDLEDIVRLVKETDRLEQVMRLATGEADESILDMYLKAREQCAEFESGVCGVLRDVREERGMSQEAVTERLAVVGYRMHQTTYAKLEAGKRPMRLSELYALSKVFDVPLSYFFFDDEHPLTWVSHSLEMLRNRIDQVLEGISTAEYSMDDLLRKYKYIGDPASPGFTAFAARYASKHAPNPAPTPEKE